ncbi:MAG: extracellular solute-binding protein [Clostridia bacterium]|nr:extracellular solute-binding protein [Clostridia bacterium]
MKKLFAMALALCLLLGGVVVASAEETTTLTMWTFIAQHQEFFEKAAERWNSENPDRPIAVEVTTIGYDDMHNKLKVALQADEGAPDMCDVELGQFPNVLAYSDKLVDLTDALSPYMADLVKARLEIYAKDGKYYGAPLHVGAMVSFYDVALLESAGVNYEDIKTRDDWYEAGLKLKEADPDAWMGTVETSTQWVASLMLAQQGTDWQDGESAFINTPEVAKIIDTQKTWLEAGIAEVCPGGQPDTEEGKAYIANNKIASVIMPFWYMSRFTDEIGESCKDRYVVAPAPVFEEGQLHSIGQGGTGTVVYANGTDPELCAEFLAFAKVSPEGEAQIWEVLGFDPCNTSIWDDDAIMKTDDNKFNQYFIGYPIDALLPIKDEIGYIVSTSISPTINNYLDTTLWNEVYVDGVDTAEALENAQDSIDSDLF